MRTERPGRSVPLWLRPTALIGVGARLAPPGLLKAAAAKQLAQIPESLPKVGCVGAFEIRLEDEHAPVDFEVCLRASRAVREKLGAWLTGGEATQLAAGYESWARTTRFLAAWSDPRSELCSAVPIIWLEFDAPPGGGEPQPFVVLTLDQETFHPGGVADRQLLSDFLAKTFALIGDGLDAEVEATLRSCLEALPPAAEFAHAAVRPGPAGDVARLVVRLEARSMPEKLAGLGWEGSRDQLRSLLDGTFTTRAVHPVNLDLGSRIGRRVGLEFHHPTSPVADPRWRRFLDTLTAAGACSPAQRGRIETWPLPSEREPQLTHVDRDLLVKVIYETGAALRAKAYLSFAVELPALEPVEEFTTEALGQGSIC